MSPPLLLLLSAALTLFQAEEQVTHRGSTFTLNYPGKNSKLQPPSARVPFQLEYRKNSMVRLETEHLTQPIDLADSSFAAIFLDVQLERVKERVQVPLESRTVRKYPWGTGIEFVYYLPSRNGKKNERDKVTEVVTTVGETLYRFTTWIPERDVPKVEPVLAGLVASFAPLKPAGAAAAATASATASTGASAGGSSRPGFSIAALEARVRELRSQAEAKKNGNDDASLAEVQAGLAETLGLELYLSGKASPSAIDELGGAAASAMRLAPGKVASQRARAWASYHKNQMVEMETAIQEALRIDPNDAQAHFLYALWYGFDPRHSGEMARAAIAAYPELAPAHFVKALADRRAGDLAEARSSLERALALDPTFTRAREELADLLEESGDVQAALASYRILSQQAPDDVRLHFRLGVVARKAGLVDEAITEYQTAIRLEPTLSEAHYNLAVVYLQEKKAPDLAAQSFQRFLELDPESDRAEAVRQWLRDNRY
jgi:tetratricopeptide (TPR) repeat protein